MSKYSDLTIIEKTDFDNIINRPQITLDATIAKNTTYLNNSDKYISVNVNIYFYGWDAGSIAWIYVRIGKFSTHTLNPVKGTAGFSKGRSDSATAETITFFVPPGEYYYLSAEVSGATPGEITILNSDIIELVN